MDSPAGKLINGGGFFSMFKMLLIVGISSGYFGFFKETDLLVGVKKFVNKMFNKLPKMLLMSLMSTMISVFSSNQTLSIMLTYEMARESYEDKDKLALDMENSAVMTPVLHPLEHSRKDANGNDWRTSNVRLLLLLPPLHHLSEHNILCGGLL